MSTQVEPRTHWVLPLRAALQGVLNATPFADDARWAAFLRTGAYTARTLLAIGIAVFCAFMFQLQSPLSAATTVLIVANPTVGAMVSKSLWRVVGTIIGATIAVGVMAVFVQAPVLYFAALSVFVGIACAVATFLRFFRSYAAVLVGYTIVIIAAPAFAEPENIFLSAMSRLSAVVVGVVVTAFVFMATSPRKPSGVLAKLGDAFRDTIRHAWIFHIAESERTTTHATNAPTGDEAVLELLEKREEAETAPSFRNLPQPVYDSRAKLLAHMAGLAPAIEYAAADDPDMLARIGNLRLGLSRLTGLIVSYHPYWLTLAEAGDETHGVHALMADTLARILDMTETPAWLENPAPLSACLHDALKALEHLTRDPATPLAPAMLAALDNTRDALVQMDLALYNLTSLRREKARAAIVPYLEWPMALRNGARGAAIAMLAGMLWYVFHWSTGPLLILYVVAASSLLATLPSAAKASPMMAAGTALGVPAGFLCHTLALPRIDGYPLLWLSLCVFLLPGVWLQFHPKLGLPAFGYVVFFLMMLSINNPITYNDLELTNNWMTMLAACALLAIVFRVILPADHRLDAARLVTSLSRGVQKLARAPHDRAMQWVAWEGLQLQKISRLMMRLSFIPTGLDRQGYTDAAFAALSLGRLIVRLRWNATHASLDPLARRTLDAALESFSTLRQDPAATADTLRKASFAIRSIPHEEQGLALTRERTVSCLEQAANIIMAVPGFFHHNGPIQHPMQARRAAEPVSTMPEQPGLRLG
ncbi:FUSC family protein [Acetobacter sp. TBRC 12305]|uniref:FUSC family protein n=1 Tax=Acetobacter garciniae TaxID=2817435 RepID=A0A939KQE8_9PROT|nr:FUSC family protein [Acetobacter garciniae]MBO1325242.1 FUSC family protein [Acetobacter garciniae]MBX0344786.1 FUSC family protein [Acetobacter garciniae]